MNKTRNINFRLEPADAAAVRAAADLEELAVSVWARRIIVRQAREAVARHAEQKLRESGDAERVA